MTDREGRFGAASLRGRSNSAFFEVETSNAYARSWNGLSLGRSVKGSNVRCVSSRRGVDSLLGGSHVGWERGLLFRAIGVPGRDSTSWRKEANMPMEEYLSVAQPHIGSEDVPLAECTRPTCNVFAVVRFRRDLRGGI